MYFNIKSKNVNRETVEGKLVDSSFVSNMTPEDMEFFQFEPAVVVDIILDETHPELESFRLSVPASPKKSDGEPHETGETDLSYIGRALVRMQYSQRGAIRSALRWATPINFDMTSFPLINEVVNVVEIDGELYYGNRININNRVNLNADYTMELYNSSGFGKPIDPDTISNNTPREYKGPKNVISTFDTTFRRNFGVNGRYFSFNDKIRRLKRYEGDTVIESRFGQSIRFAAYDYNGKNDIGLHDDYKQEKNNPFSERSESAGGGNPMLLIRNRQRKINYLPKDYKNKNQDEWSLENQDGIRVGHEDKFNSTIHENINWDGSSIHMTSGLTFTKFNRDWHFAKKHWQDEVSDVKIFSPSGSTRWIFPEKDSNSVNPFWGDQTILMSDRIIIASRKHETLHFAKKRYGIVCDQEYTVDAHEQMVFTTDEKVVFNSPHIYLGEYNQTREPALLGQSAIDWLYALCEWLEKHQHWYHHVHPDAPGAEDGTAPTGNSDKPYTQEPVSQHVALLREMKKRLPEICSRRVFLTGGGYAPGRDGAKIEELFNDKVGNINKTPGGYYVAKTGEYNGKMVTSTTNGEIGPSADFNGKNPNFIKHPNSMKSSH